MRDIIIKYKRYIICALCVISALAGRAYRTGVAGNISMQQPWARWSGNGTGCGYAAAYIPDREGLDEETVKGYAQNYQTLLKEESFEKPANARLYVDAYSSERMMEISKDIGTSRYKVNVTAVGGDYFFFHPMRLLSGSYINGSDLMHDGIVLDENAAWSLYGGTDIQGMKCVINNKYYYIEGVVEAGGGRFAGRTYGSRNRVFMHFDECVGIDETIKINTYELVYPELITGKTKSTLESVLGIEDAGEQVEGAVENESPIEVVDMTKRFGFPRLFGVVSSYGTRSLKTTGTAYPFWENECRMAEDYAAVAVVWEIIFLAIAVIVIIPSVVKAYKISVSFGGKIVTRIRERFR